MKKINSYNNVISREIGIRVNANESYKNISDDDAQAYLSHEKENEQLWNKKIAGLRDSYKEKEAAQAEEQKLMAEAEQKQQ